MKIQIILGSTRPGRIGEGVAKWVHEVAAKRDGVEYELVDIADFNLPMLDEAMPASMGQYANEHTKKWAEKIAEADGYVFVVAEYNHSVAGALKNAVDYLSAEWANKSLGFVAYGSIGGARAIEHWRGIAAQLKLADVRETALFFLGSDFENYSTFKPSEAGEAAVDKVLDEVEEWAGALKPLRNA